MTETLKERWAKRKAEERRRPNPHRSDDGITPFPTFPTVDYAPPTAPDPPASIDPGGGSSGGGGASGDW